ncbi:MAG: translation initiation factor IF-2, partial [Angelakisella sp.]
MMLEKYRVNEVAKDLGTAAKDISTMLDSKFAGEPHKNMTALTADELNYVFEEFTQKKTGQGLDSYFAMKKPEPVAPPAPKPAEAAPVAAPAASVASKPAEAAPVAAPAAPAASKPAEAAPAAAPAAPAAPTRPTTPPVRTPIAFVQGQR